MLILVLVLLAPLAANIPLCTLAAILFVVAYTMSDVPHFIRTIKHAPRYDAFILVVTFLLTVFTNLVVAVNVGVVLAMLFFIHKMNQSVSIDQQQHEELKPELEIHGMSELSHDTIVYTIQGPFFFGAAEKIEHTLATTHTDPKTIIFRLKNVPFMDMTGLETFSELIEHYHKRKVAVYLCEANPHVLQKLTDVDIIQWLVDKRIFNTFAEVLKIIKK